jgi:hypothetical protein
MHSWIVPCLHLEIKPTPNQTIGNDAITGLSKYCEIFLNSKLERLNSLKLKQNSSFLRDGDAARVLH